jgi:hypothetical protein
LYIMTSVPMVSYPHQPAFFSKGPIAFLPANLFFL